MSTTDHLNLASEGTSAVLSESEVLLCDHISPAVHNYEPRKRSNFGSVAGSVRIRDILRLLVECAIILRSRARFHKT